MFRYTVTEQDYLKMAKWLLVKQRGPENTAIPKLLVKTVVQMGAAAWLVLNYPEQLGAWTWVLIAFSLLYAGLVLFRFFFLGVRANMLLKQAKQEAGAADFWKEHQLKIDGENLQLSYGSVRSELPCRDVTEIEEWEDLSLILRGGDVFEALPASVTASEEWTLFRSSLLETRDRDQQRKQEELKNTLLKSSDFHAYIRITQEEAADKIVQMKRRSLLYPSGWTFMSFFVFLFPLGVGIYAASGGAWQTLIFCLVFFVILNWQLLSLFFPSFRRRVRKQVQPPGEDGYLLALQDKTVYLLTGRNAFEYPMQNVRRSARFQGDLFLYFKQQRMLFIPAEYADAFLRALKGEKSMREKAGKIS